MLLPNAHQIEPCHPYKSSLGQANFLTCCSLKNLYIQRKENDSLFTMHCFLFGYCNSISFKSIFGVIRWRMCTLLTREKYMFPIYTLYVSLASTLTWWNDLFTFLDFLILFDSHSSKFFHCVLKLVAFSTYYASTT